MSNFEKVKEWMTIAGQVARKRPSGVAKWDMGPPKEDGPVTFDEAQLRERLITEEVAELLLAIQDNDLVEIADGIADALYVIYGTAVTFGIDADYIFDIVHKNNLTKFNPCPKCVIVATNGELVKTPSFKTCHECDGKEFIAIKREDGKVMKNPTWEPPDFPVLGLR